MRGVDGGLPDLLDVRRVAEAGEGESVVQLEDLRAARAHAQQQNAVGQADGEDGRAAPELFADVFAAVRDRLQPTIGFLGMVFRFSSSLKKSLAD